MSKSFYSPAEGEYLEVVWVYIRYLPEPVYLIERFDRTGQYPSQQRLHVLDGCQILNLSPVMKYNNSTAASLKKLANIARMKGKTLLEIFRWALFNAIVGNGDAHLKNLSFFVRKNDIVMTPHYDLVSTIIYEPAHQHMQGELSQPMGNARTFGELSKSNVLAFAEEIGLQTKLAEIELQKMTAKITSSAQRLQNQVNEVDYHPGKAGEVRMVAQIVNLCIKEAVALISR